MSAADDFDAIPTDVKPTGSLADQFDAVPASGGSSGGSDQVQPWYMRFMNGVASPLDRGVQLLTNAVSSVGEPIAKAIGANDLAQSFRDSANTVNQEQANNDKAYTAANSGLKGPDWWRLTGQMASPVNFVGGPEGLVPNIVRGAVTAPLFADAPDPSKPYWPQVANQAAWGAGTGAALTGLGNVVGKIINPAVGSDVKTLLDAGVTPTPGQVAGGALGRIEEAATSIPIIGDFIKAGQRNALTDFNQAVYNRALAPVGEKVPEGITGHEAVEYVANKLGDKYDQLLPKLSFAPDAQFHQDMGNLRLLVSSLPESEAKQFGNILDNQLSKASPQGLMNGETLKNVTGEINRLSRGYMSDPSFDKRQLGNALSEASQTLMSAVERQNPQNAQELKAINEGWANYSRIRRAASSTAAPDGVFTPTQLNMAAKAGDQSVGKGDFAKGNALLQDLSSAGKNVLSQKVPDSGTATRGLLMALGAGGGVNLLSPEAAIYGGIGAGIAGGAYSRPGMNLLASIMAKRPEGAEKVAAAAKNAIPLFAGAVARPINQMIAP